MNISANGAAELLTSEGIVTSRYRDSVGVWTIGVGHTKAAGGVDPAKVMRVLSLDECLQIFSEDIPKYVGDVNRVVRVPVTQYEFDALVSFHFNTGAIGRAALTSMLNAGMSRSSVGAAFMNWSTPPSIVERRRREMNLFLNGKYSPNPKVPVYSATQAGTVQWGKATLMDPMPALVRMFPSILPPALPEGKPVLRVGSKGPAVAEWQEYLGEYSITIDGDFGPRTEAATKAWQLCRNLVPDGVVGAKTWKEALSQDPA